MGKLQPSLLKKFMRAAESGAFALPRGWSLLMRYPTEELKLQHAFPKRLQLPEEGLFKAFYEKYPAAKLQPIKLKSFEPPLAKKFVVRQLQLMEQGLDRTSSFTQAETEHKDEIVALTRSGESSSVFMQIAQDQEEQQLQSALRKLSSSRKELAK